MVGVATGAEIGSPVGAGGCAGGVATWGVGVARELLPCGGRMVIVDRAGEATTPRDASAVTARAAPMVHIIFQVANCELRREKTLWKGTGHHRRLSSVEPQLQQWLLFLY